MMKQYGIDPRLVIWIQRNTGHDLQTFSDLAKMKSLDSRRRNFSSARKIEDIRLPSWLMVKENDFSLIGEMTKLKQLSLHDVAIDDYSFLAGCRSLSTLDLQDTSFSDCRLLAELPALKKVLLPPYSQLKHTEVLERLSCIREIKEEKEEKPKAAGQSCGEGTPSEGNPAPCGPLHLGDTAHLSIDGMEMIRQLYGVEELQGYTEEELAVVKKYFSPLPPVLEEFWNRAARTEAIHRVQDEWIRPEDFDKWDWLKDSDYLVLLIENQGCCRAGIRRKDLTKADPPVYVAADQINDQRWTLCAGTLSGFLRAVLAYEAVFAFPFHGDELMYWLTEEELETVRSGLEKQPFGLSGWLGMDMSFYSNASDNIAVIMDCGDLEVLYGAASEAGYKRLMEVMKGIGEPL